MEHITEDAWKAELHLLSESEVSNPRKALVPIFDASAPRCIEDELWCWFKAVISNNIWDYASPTHLMAYSKKLEKLIEISWLINKKRIGMFSCLAEKGKIDVSFQPDAETRVWPFIPQHHLRPAEISDPYLALADFFSYYSLPEIRSELFRWLEVALTSKNLVGQEEPEDLLLFFEMVARLVKAVYLIKSRELDEAAASMAFYR